MCFVLSNLLRFLFFIVLSFQFQIYARYQYSLNGLAQKLIGHKPDILYFADTNHDNFRLLSAYVMIVSQIRETAPEYDCVFLEVDKQIFQPAIEAFMGGISWQDSIGIAQNHWEKITNGTFKRVPEPFLSRMRELGLRIFAVDENRRRPSFQNERGNEDVFRWKRHYERAINDRNSLMAQNIHQVLTAEDERGKPVCTKALMFVGGLHLAEDIVMFFGRQKYQSIASHPKLRNYSQAAHTILDCDDLHATSFSSKENMEQCDQFRASEFDSVTIENLLEQGDFFSVASIVSSSQTAGRQQSTFPKINYNIMTLSD